MSEKSAAQLKSEIVRWLRGNENAYRSKARIANRKTAAKEAALKASVYEFVAGWIEKWETEE